MSNLNEICLIGDVLIDITLKQNSKSENKLRFGGIVHAARGLWALDSKYSIANFNPQYLDTDINNFLSHHGCSNIMKIGNVTGTPYLFFINEAKEIGNQGYEFILRENVRIDLDENNLKLLKTNNYQDCLLISGNYDFNSVVSNINTNSEIHLDIANNTRELMFLKGFPRKLSTIFLSTSSYLFKKLYKDDFIAFSNYFKEYTNRFILKENRGGSRAINFSTNEVLCIPSQTHPISHSVGVGDVFDATYVFFNKKYSFRESLELSSWIAAEYASTTYPDDFKKSVENVLKSDVQDLISMGGVSLPWESRNKINIYIAAPDFDYLNIQQINQLCDSLDYHNFKPRRPVRENGFMEQDASFFQKQRIFSKDMQLLYGCHILIAVLINNDPGTFIEIGIAATKGIPTIVYDPYNIASNCMLTQLPNFISNDLDEIISEVFICSAKLNLLNE